MRNILFILLIISLASKGQFSIDHQAKVDSLNQAIKTAKHDSTLVASWIAWDNIIYLTDPELDFILNQKIDSLCELNLDNNLSKQEKTFFLKSKSVALNNIGIIYKHQGDFAKAIEYYSESQKIREEIEDKPGIAATLNNIGLIYRDQGDFAKAIEYYSKSLKIREEIGDKLGVAMSLNNIGIIYKDQGDFTKAIDYYFKSLKIKEELGDKKGISASFNNIGGTYANQGDYTKAIDYHSKSLKIDEELGDKKGIAISLNNIGFIYANQEEFAKAIEYYSKSLKIDEKIGNKLGIASSLNDIGGVYASCGDYAKALGYCLRSLSIAQEVNAVAQTRRSAKSLWTINKKLNRHKEALEMHELYITMRDSINSEENRKEVIRQELKYNYEKQADSIAIELSKKEELSKAEQKRKEDLATKENEKKNLIIAAGAGLLVLTLIFTLFVINRLRITRKQKSTIEDQKKIVEKAHKETERQKHLIVEVHTEITDSIKYAKRLQDAILPSFEEVNKYLPNNFILFKPKDLVSGDFYWFEQSSGTAYLAAADCTGHGVPGAMVSVVCSNALNRSVKEFGITEPSKILDKTRELVIETFANSSDEVKDGMDIALCAFKDNKVIYSGANNPLWIVRKTDLITEAQKQERSTVIQNGLSLIEYKANKQPIGLYDGMKKFRQEVIELKPGDSIYFFTDGFADQFGGEKGKKFKYKPFKRFLIELQTKPMKVQEQLISTTFENWRGQLEQIDDVCIIGVKFE